MIATFLLKPFQTLETFFASRQEGCLYKEIPQGVTIKEWLSKETVVVVVHQDHYEIILIERLQERISFRPNDYSLWLKGTQEEKEKVKNLFPEIDLMAICKAIDEEDFRRRGVLPSRNPKRQTNTLVTV